MRNCKEISVYEHQRLYVDKDVFTQRHLNALLKLNEYHDFCYFDVIANGIKFKQYVGVIQVDNLLIEIHPKADQNDANTKWRNVLLHMLQACGKLKATSFGDAKVSKANLNLLEVYFELYLQELQKLIHQGLIKQYRKQTANVKALKGKLEFSGHIKHNLVHKERFYTTHQVYDKDHLLHQILASALAIVTDLSQGSQLYDHCQRVQLNFPVVMNIKVVKSHFDTIKWNRKTEPYRYALEIARLIILNYSPSIQAGQEKMISLLFDMNRLWEEYVFTKLRKYCADKSYILKAHDSRNFINSNTLKPDIVLKVNKKVYIIDTKWKIPDNAKGSIVDLRQVYTYARFWQAEKVMLLYPGKRNNEQFSFYNNRDHDGINHQCKIGFVSVIDNDGNLDEGIGAKVLQLLELDK